MPSHDTGEPGRGLEQLSGAVRPMARVGEIITNAWIWCVRHALAVPVLAIATFPLLFLQDGAGVDTQSGPIPDLTIIAYYLVFFAGGWMLYRRREHLNAIARLWMISAAWSPTM